MKLFIVISLLLIGNICFSQTFINRSGAANTVVDQRLGAAQNFYLPRLMDTTLSGGLDTIGNLIYDRLRAKIAIRDTVLTGGHKFTFLFKTDDTLSTLATKYDITQIPTQNISNAALTADGNYSQNWSENQWYVDSIASSFLFRMGGVGSTGTRRKEFRINWGGSSFGDQIDGFNILASVKKGDNSGDSLTMGIMSSGTGVFSVGTFNTTNSTQNTFTSYSAVSGLLNINARDSIWIKGAVPASTADSILGVRFVSGTGISKIVKIPFPAVAGTPTWDAVLGAGNIGVNKSAFLINNIAQQVKFHIENIDTTNDNSVSRVDILSRRGKAVVSIEPPQHSEGEIQYFKYINLDSTSYVITDSLKSYTIGTVSDLDSRRQLRGGFLIKDVEHNIDLMCFDPEGRIGTHNVSAPKAALHIGVIGGIPDLKLDPEFGSPTSAAAGDIHNIGTNITYTDNSGTVYDLANQIGIAPNGSYTAPSFSFAANSAAGMSYNAIIGTPVISSNSGANDAMSFANSNSGGNSGYSLRDHNFTQRAVMWLNNGNSRLRLAAASGISIDFEAGGYNDNDPTMRLTSGGRVYIKGLDTDNSPPSTSGTTKIVITDGNGNLSFADILTIGVTTSAAATLTLSNSESYIFNGTTTTWTLPAVSGTTGRIYYIKNIGSGSITLNADSGSNEIYSSSAVNTITVTAGSAIILISNGTYFTVN